MHRTSAIILAILKWPIALLFAASLPVVIVALVAQINVTMTTSTHRWPLIYGMLAYILIWFFLLRKTSINWLSTLEHELTHCIFAWLTWNRVTALHASWRSGGHMRFTGTSNWLMLTAPYFFPTVTVFTLLAMAIFGASYNAIFMWITGASISYHGISTFIETHCNQSDLKEVGILFSWLFLPAANAISFALILAYVNGGTTGIGRLFRLLVDSPLSPMRLVSLV